MLKPDIYLALFILVANLIDESYANFANIAKGQGGKATMELPTAKKTGVCIAFITFITHMIRV